MIKSKQKWIETGSVFTSPNFLLITVYALLILLFIVSRWGVWCFFPYGFISSDGFEYLDVAYQIKNKTFPSFHFISAGYPLFIFFIKLISSNGFAVFFGQQLLSLFSCMVLVYSFRKRKKIFLFISLISGIYILSDHVIKWETTLFPDSVIGNSLILFAVSGLNYFRKNRFGDGVIFSMITLFLVLLRSSNVFVLPLALTILAITYFNTKYQRVFLKTLLTMIVMFVLYASYNALFSLGNKFSILTYGRMEKHIKYADGVLTNSKPEYVEIKINTYEQDSIAEACLNKLPTNFPLYNFVFPSSSDTYFSALKTCRHFIYAESPDSATLNICYTTQAASIDSVGKHCHIIQVDGIPAASAAVSINQFSWKKWNLRPKNVFFRIKTYFDNISFEDGALYYSMIFYSLNSTATQNDFYVRMVKDAYPDTHFVKYALPEISLIDSAAKTNALYANPFFKLYDMYYNMFFIRVIKNKGHSILYLLSSLLILWVLIKNPKNEFSFFLFTCFGLTLGSALTFTFFGNPLARYALTTELPMLICSFYVIYFFVVYIYRKIFHAP